MKVAGPAFSGVVASEVKKLATQAEEQILIAVDAQKA